MIRLKVVFSSGNVQIICIHGICFWSFWALAYKTSIISSNNSLTSLLYILGCEDVLNNSRGIWCLLASIPCLLHILLPWQIYCQNEIHITHLSGILLACYGKYNGQSYYILLDEYKVSHAYDIHPIYCIILTTDYSWRNQ